MSRRYLEMRVSRSWLAGCFAVVCAFSLSGCISISYSRPVTPEEEEAALAAVGQKLRAALTKDDVVRNARLLVDSDPLASGQPSTFTKSQVQDLVAPLQPALEIAAKAHHSQLANMREMATAMIEDVNRRASDRMPERIELTLQITQTGQPLAYIDPAKNTFYMDLRVLRALYVSSIARHYVKEDFQQHIEDLRYAKAEFATGRKSKADYTSIPEIDYFGPTAAQRKHIEERRAAAKARVERRTPEQTARQYSQAVDLLLSMSDGEYGGFYRWPTGESIQPRSITWDLYAHRILGDVVQSSLVGGFLTILLHEMGHVALSHGDIDLTRVSCSFRTELELEADAYSAILRSLSGIDRKYVFPDLFGMLETLGGGVPKAEGIEDFFDVAYRVSGFDQQLTAKAPSTAECYPKVSERLALSKRINEDLVGRINKEVAAKKQKCLEKRMALSEDELKQALRRGEFERTVDLTNLDCPDED